MPTDEVKVSKYRGVVVFTIAVRAYYIGEAFGVELAREVVENLATLDTKMVHADVYLKWAEFDQAEPLPTTFAIEDIQLIEDEDNAN